MGGYYGFGLPPRGDADARARVELHDAPALPTLRRVTVTVERFGDDTRTTLEARDVLLADAPAVAGELEAAIASAFRETPALVPRVGHVGGERFEIVDEGDGCRGRITVRGMRPPG